MKHALVVSPSQLAKMYNYWMQRQFHLYHRALYLYYRQVRLLFLEDRLVLAPMKEQVNSIISNNSPRMTAADLQWKPSLRVGFLLNLKHIVREIFGESHLFVRDDTLYYDYDMLSRFRVINVMPEELWPLHVVKG